MHGIIVLHQEQFKVMQKLSASTPDGATGVNAAPTPGVLRWLRLVITR